jgi:2-hydroxy-palmitic acid dioxygenase Mpo1-like
MTSSGLLRWQWEGYPRYHQSRFNLLLHIVFVPLFVVSNIAFLVAIVQRSWLVGIVAVVVMAFAIALQGRGHRHEPVPPEPFTSPLNAVSRIFLEQWVTFPRFVLSGGWWWALRHSAATRHR